MATERYRAQGDVLGKGFQKDKLEHFYGIYRLKFLYSVPQVT